MSANTEMSRLDSIPTATLEKLLSMAESGGSGAGALVVHVQLDESVFTCDKTAGEMYAAAQNGLVTVLQDQGGGYYSVGLISGFSFDENGYYFQVTFISTTRQVDFEATEANDYPTGQEGGASPE